MEREAAEARAKREAEEAERAQREAEAAERARQEEEAHRHAAGRAGRRAPGLLPLCFAAAVLGARGTAERDWVREGRWNASAAGLSEGEPLTLQPA